MEKIIISVSPEKLQTLKEKLEEEISEESFMEVAIVITGPSQEMLKMGFEAMANGASLFSRG